eukprot:s2291_g4.t2
MTQIILARLALTRYLADDTVAVQQRWKKGPFVAIVAVSTRVRMAQFLTAFSELEPLWLQHMKDKGHLLTGCQCIEAWDRMTGQSLAPVCASRPAGQIASVSALLELHACARWKQVGDVVSIDAKAVRSSHHCRVAGPVTAVESPDGQQPASRRRLLAALHLSGLSLNAARRAIRAGRVRLGGAVVTDPACLVAPELALSVAETPVEEVEASTELQIHQEEDEFLAVWKPVDMSLVELDVLVTRLDASLTRLTRVEGWACGLVLVAKTAEFARVAKHQLCEGEVKVKKVPKTSSCHFLFLVDCDRSMREIWSHTASAASAGRISELRVWSSSWWIRNKGQMQILECVCPCPAPGTKLLASLLAGLGYTILGRKGCKRKPLKCVIAWTLQLDNRCIHIRAPVPEAFTKVFESAKDGWLRHRQVFPEVSDASAVRSFCGRGFGFDGAMAPRLGTEVIAQAAAQRLTEGGSLLDLGTGSGCIAITALLDASATTASAVGIDLAPLALQTAAANGRRLLPETKKLEVRKMCFSELFGDGLTTEGFQGFQGFDVVVSNPPYLTQSQAQELCQPGDSTEPLQCFTLKRSAAIRRSLAHCEARPGELDGAVAVYAIIVGALVTAQEVGRPLLKPGGALILEVPSSMERRVRGLVESYGTPQSSLGKFKGRDATPWTSPLGSLDCFQFLPCWPARTRPVGLVLEQRLVDAHGLFRGFVFRNGKRRGFVFRNGKR